MAEIRVRLQFEYPPPAGPESRQMWMLLNPGHLRTVTDLSDLIRARYYPKQRGALCLYVHDCLLPPGESARLIRDNDIIRVQWNGYASEDELDSDSQTPVSKKRSRQRCEEDAEDSSTVLPKKRRYELLRTKTHRSKMEQVVLDETEEEESLGNSKKKAKKKRKVSGEKAQEVFPEGSSEKNKGKKHSENSTSLKATKKNLNLISSNHEHPRKKTRASSGSSLSPEESSEMSLNPHKKFSKKSIKATTLSGNKPNSEPPTRSARQISSSDSKTSSDQDSSTKRKKPSKGLNKFRSAVSVKKTKPNHEPPAVSEAEMSSSDSSSSDQESSSIGNKPSKAIVSVSKNNLNHPHPAEKARSNTNYSPYDKELPTARKIPCEDTSSPSNLISAKSVFSSEIGKKKNSPAPHNGETSNRRMADIVTATPVNGTSQKSHRKIPSSGSDSDTCTIQKPVPVQNSTSVVPSCVSNGHETDSIQHGHAPHPGLYDRGRGRGRGIFPWRGQGGRGFRGRGDQGKGRGYGVQFFHSYDTPALKKQQLEEPATNTSVVIQNPPESPGKDYNTFPLLAAPPQVGKVIAFKILELNENYSPELSDYKEGVVRSYDMVTQQIEVELLSRQKKREPGKFDLVYESEDGREIVEYAVLPDCKIVEPWSSLVTPRLVMEKGSEEGTLTQAL